MPIDIKIRSFVTYYQEEEPTDAVPGDVWFRPSQRLFYIKHKEGLWKKAGTPSMIGYGYAWGFYMNDAYQSFVRRMDFATESFSITSTVLADSYSATGLNSSVHAYLLGGASVPQYPTTLIQRFAFPFDGGVSEVVGNIHSSKHSIATCNSSSQGYGSLGCSYYTDTGNAYYTSVTERIAFPFAAGTSVISSYISQGGHAVPGCNSSQHGFIPGRYIMGVEAITVSYIDRFAFPFESGVSVQTGYLSGARMHHNAVNSSSAGFTMGGIPSWPPTVWFSTVDRFMFPLDSGTAAHVGDLAYATQLGAGFNSSTCGYTSGGITVNDVNLSAVQRITFPFDSGVATIIGSLPDAEGRCVGVDNVDFVQIFTS